MAISEEILDILCCPKCRGDLVLMPSGEGFVCNACRLMYPIRDDIVIWLEGEAIPIPADEHK